MTDPVTALAEILHTGYPTVWHERADFWRSVAGTAMSFAREQVPTRDAIIRCLTAEFGLDAHVCDPKWYGPIASTLLRDLQRRLGEK